MRLDKYLSKATLMSRSASASAIKRGRVTVNGTVAKSGDLKVDENIDDVRLDGELLEYEEFIYIMMNKPAGVLSATEDGKGVTVLDLLPEEYRNKGLFPAGRLDKDTVGFLLLTNDGALAHRLLSPKYHVDKKYFLQCENKLSDEDVKRLCEGVRIDADTVTAPAIAQPSSDGMSCVLTIREGKFHQIKRMLEAVGNKVTFLERTHFADIPLDASLERGQWRRLTSEEKEILRRK